MISRDVLRRRRRPCDTQAANVLRTKRARARINLTKVAQVWRKPSLRFA
jgi:hypothetical protein